jgi:hypothetical protein
MSVLQNNPFLLASGNPTDPTFPLQRSVRLRSSATAYFNRVPATAGNRKTWTWSGWVKRGALGSNQALFESGASSSVYTLLWFNSSDQIALLQDNGAGGILTITTAALFRDPSAWYHVVMAVDTTQAVSNNRTVLYVNGINQTLTYTTQLGQNADTWVNFTYQHRLGYRVGSNSALDGYLTQVNFVDGQALTPASFGGYNPGTGVWEPRQYTGTYGTNGFYLPFTNNASLEALGYDLSISSPELITNGMFVTNVTGWTSAPFGGGSPSITWQSNHTARIANPSNNGTVYYQAITTVIGETYYAQAYVAAASIGGAARTIALQKADNTAYSINNAVIASLAQSAAPGVMRGTFVATATTTYIFINVDILGSGTTGADVSQISVAAGGYKDSWNPFGISLTAGTTYDSMLDVPTNTSNTNANFCTFNPLDTGGGSVTLSGANLNYSIASSAGSQVRGTIGTDLTSKWYFEFTAGSVASPTNPQMFGLSTLEGQITNNQASLRKAVYAYFDAGTNHQSQYVLNGTTQTINPLLLNSAAIGDTFQIAYDAATGRVWFGKNNTWYDSANGTTGNPSAGTNPTITIATGDPMTPYVGNLGATYSGSLNCGQRPFAGTVPTGFKSLNTYNLPDPAITKPVSVHNLYTYTGNGGGLQVGEIQKPLSLFNLDRSLRFRSSASAYLNRTFATPTNTIKWTWSGWVKRGALTTGQLFSAGQTNTYPDFTGIYFVSDNLQVVHDINGTVSWAVTTSAIFRDPSLWYHVVVDYDSAQATPANRVLIYVNGVLQVVTGTYPLQNNGTFFNTTREHMLGAMWGGATRGQYLDGYLADVYFIDGQALTPDSFGQYDGNYYWTPKAYTGTYGTNGFHLEFEDFSASTAAAIGKDTSGQGNNWTPSAGINLTIPANTNTSWDSMTDVPTLTNADTANFATLNPLTGSNIGSGNLQVTGSGAGDSHTSTIALPTTGKWYAEMSSTAYNASTIVGWFGVANRSGTNFSGLLSRVTGAGGGYVTNDVVTTAVNVGALNNVFGVAVDMDAGTVRIYIDGVLQATTVSITPNIEMFFYYGTYTSGTGWVNFGQRPFKYSNYGVDRPAVTFKALNSFNIAEVVGDVESPDFVWIKSRSASGDHTLFNSVTGVGKYLRSNSNLPVATDVNSLIQFNKNGFLLGNSTVANTLATTYIAAAWKMSATTATNNNGSVSSQVRANTNAGISIATFTTPASGNFTVGHGLGKIPSMFILKTTSGTDSFYVYNNNFATPTTYYLQLNSGSVILSSASLWGSTNPTLDVVTLGVGGGIAANATGIIYSFTDIEGFSKFGRYISNNDPNGPFVYTGFKPRWLIVKRAVVTAGSTGGWFMYDAARNTYNVMDKYLFAEGTAGDNTLAVFDFTANGFKIRSNNVHVNTTAGDTYIYMAFAENPFKYALAR